jgi:hypothetical protein
MLQMFYMDVAKVDQDVVHVANIAEVCCKCLFPMFYLFLVLYCKCVYLDVAYV